MDSVLHQLFSGHFLTQDWAQHRKETVSLRLHAYRKQFASVIQDTDEDLRERWLCIMETLVGDQLDDQPDMFSLGFTLGAQLMIEVFTFC